MADHKGYMHKSFPSSQDNEHTPHLRHLHKMGHEDPNLHSNTEEGAQVDKGSV